MKILVTNPDNVGDFTLRQPMYNALAAAGHELMLVVRSTVAPLAPFIAPDARIVLCGSNPYAPDFEERLEDLAPLVASCRDFQPDRLVAAPYQRTRLDEYILEQLPEVHSVGFSGHLYKGDFNTGLDLRSSLEFTTAVAVDEAELELRKNELLCSTILGQITRLPAPAIQVDEEDRQRAAAILSQKGLEPGKYLVACVGHNQWTAIRNWRLEDWGAALKSVPERHSSILFLGMSDEFDATEEVRRHMGEAAADTVNLCDSRQSLPALVGLIAESGGYVGRDTGPMHLAAALGKTVVAVFGGGMWPRFTPAAVSGVALTVELPCSGCDWLCPYSEPHCVKGVTVDEVVDQLRRAFDESPPFEIMARPATAPLLHQLVHEGVVNTERRMRAANARIQALTTRVEKLESGITAEHSALNDTRNLTVQLQRQVDDLSNLAGRSKEALVQRDFELENLRQDSEARLEESGRLNDLLGLLKNEHTRLGEESATLESKLNDARQHLEELAQDHRELEARYADANAKIDSIRQSVFTKILTRLGLWKVFE